MKTYKVARRAQRNWFLAGLLFLFSFAFLGLDGAMSVNDIALGVASALSFLATYLLGVWNYVVVSERALRIKVNMFTTMEFPLQASSFTLKADKIALRHGNHGHTIKASMLEDHAYRELCDAIKARGRTVHDDRG